MLEKALGKVKVDPDWDLPDSDEEQYGKAYFRSIFLPMSMHVLWNWYVSYNDRILYGSGLTYFNGLALGVSYAFSWLARKL